MEHKEDAKTGRKQSTIKNSANKKRMVQGRRKKRKVNAEKEEKIGY